MKLSQNPIRTFREDPGGVDTVSQRLMYRAGLLMSVGRGVYIYTPLMYRVIRKIEQIVREEMDRAGAIELLLPILQPKELWQRTGRWDDYLKSGTMLVAHGKGGEQGLGPTAEEVITFYASRVIDSYQQLPVTWYQIGPKFRDELRPRGGLIRTREFIMKDAYSFDRDQAGLDSSYEAQRQAYERVFTRCGLTFIQVEADPGAIGGSSSHEFMVVTDAGEDKVVTCTGCDYKANVERAVSSLAVPEQEAEERPMHFESTPDTRTVDQLVALFGLSASRMVKTILYEVQYKSGRTEVVAVLMRGDCEINEVKLSNHLGNVANLSTASAEVVIETTGAEVGFAGPVGLGTRIAADESVRPLKNFLCGGNRIDYHLLDVNWGRDFTEPVFTDLRTVASGDSCVHCGSPLQITRGIEVGHLFKLGVKYSHAPDEESPYGLSATYSDESGALHDIVMGCYGIGVTRIAAAAVEISHDERGIIWPLTIAPYHLVIVTANVNREKEIAAVERLYAELNAAGVETIMDDREGRIGFKLYDADLIGYPYKLIVGKGIADGVVDLKERRTGSAITLPVDEAVARIKTIVYARLEEYKAA